MQIGFLGLLTLVFVVCKLVGVIAWSWFWVLSPLLFCVAVALFLIVLFAGLGIKYGD